MTLNPRLGRCAALLSLAMAAHAGAQTPGAGSRIHRQAVAAPATNGWVQANSTEGHYSLQIPCPYNDGTFTPENGANPERALGFVLACDRADGVRFYAMRMQYPGGRPAADEMFRRRFSGSPLAAAHMTEGQIGGRDYMDFVLDQPGRCLYGRLIRVGDDNLLMLVEPVSAPAARCSTLRTDADRFRSSIAIQE